MNRLRNAFQFHKVRLKHDLSTRMNAVVFLFQFHKVRLKHGRKIHSIGYYDRFNSIRYD